MLFTGPPSCGYSPSAWHASVITHTYARRNAQRNSSRGNQIATEPPSCSYLDVMQTASFTIKNYILFCFVLLCFCFVLFCFYSFIHFQNFNIPGGSAKTCCKSQSFCGEIKNTKFEFY